MSGRRDPSEAGGDAGVFFLLLALAACAAALFAWDALWAERFGAWRALRLAQLAALGPLLPDAYWALFDLPPADRVAAALERAAAVPGEGQREQAALFRARIDRALLPPVCLLAGLPFVALALARWRAAERVRERFDDADGYLEAQAALHPHLAPLSGERPHREPLKFDRERPSVHAKCVNPLDFARMRPPLGLEGEADRAILEGDDDFDEALAERCFARQCGPPYAGLGAWDGCAQHAFELLLPAQALHPERMLPEIRALLADGADGGSDAARALAEALRARRGKAPRDLLRDPALAAALRLREAEMVMEAHGFVLTGLMSLLEEARQGGVVLIHSLRRKLKLEDRTMWYALSSVGRRVAFAEGAGPFAHWLVERSIGVHLPSPMTVPEVGRAVRALREQIEGPKPSAAPPMPQPERIPGLGLMGGADRFASLDEFLERDRREGGTR